MNTSKTIPKARLLTAAALAGFMLIGCSQKPESANEVATQQLVEATQKAEEAAARAEAAQKALEQAQEDQRLAAEKTAAEAEQATAAAKLKTAQDRAAAAEREAAAARKRATAAERQVAAKPGSSYTEARPVATPPPAPVCQDCGTIASITPITVKGKGTDVAKVVGAIGGAYAGNQAEKYARRNTVFDVAVRMDNGTTRTVRVDDASTVSNGTRVRVNGSNLVLM